MTATLYVCKDVKAKKCRKCGNGRIILSHCGYTTFDPGYATCDNPKCGHTVKVSDVSVGDPIDNLVRAWNNDKPTVSEKLLLERRKTRALRRQLRTAGISPCV